eukprot:s6279_g5.t1
MSRAQRIDISVQNERYHGGDFLFVACPSQFEAGDFLPLCLLVIFARVLSSLPVCFLLLLRQMTLRSEQEAMVKFRATMKNAERFKGYLRMDSENLSMLLAKVTLTTCYGIPRKGEIGYISEGENEDPPEKTIREKAGRWNEIDPIGVVEPPHHTDSGYRVPDETKNLPLGDDSTPTAIGAEFSKSCEEIGRKTKESIDKDVAVEGEFFKQAEGKIPRRSGDDPVFAETPIDIFEALPEELDVIPDDLYVVRSPRVSVPEDPRQRIVPTKRASQGAEERDPPWRKQRYESKGQTRDRGAQGDADQRPRDLYMPPPRDPPLLKVFAQEEARLPHTEGEVIRVTGRSPFADKMNMKTPLRIKTVVPSDDLSHPTVERYQLYHASDALPIVRQQAAEMIAKLGALPSDEINCGLAGIVPSDDQNRAQSPASASTSPAEDINPGFQGTSGRTAFRQPMMKVRREEEWVPTMQRGTPMSMSDAAADRGRSQDEARSEPPQPTGVMGVAKNTTPQQRTRPTDFSADDDSSIRPTGGGKAKGKGKHDKGKGKPDKGKGKGDKGGRRQDGSRPPRPKGGERTRSPPATRHR